MINPDCLIAIPGGHIVIQSCDEETANIGVFVGHKSAYRHCTLPVLAHDMARGKPNELPMSEYDKAINDNFQTILERIRVLNG